MEMLRPREYTAARLQSQSMDRTRQRRGNGFEEIEVTFRTVDAKC